jgi:hypothetical protein
MGHRVTILIVDDDEGQTFIEAIQRVGLMMSVMTMPSDPERLP